jgi:predicted nucleic acid-binding Zn ribbon protein
MARKSNEQPLGEAIRDMLSAYRLEGKLQKARVIEAWPKVTGKMITNHTKDMYFKGAKLFVKIDSPALKTELSYSKSQIIEELNKIVGEEVVKDIVFS